MGSIGSTTARRTLLSALVAALALTVAIPAAAKEPKSEEEKTLYFLGVLAAGSLDRFHLTKDEAKLVQQGMTEGLEGTAMKLDRQTYAEKAQALMQQRAQAALVVEKQASEEFLAAEAAKSGVRKLESGVLVEDLVAGTGESPTVEDTVEVHYHGMLRDGSVFDSSVERGQTFKTALKQVVKCWQDGVPAMKKGGKSRLICPPDLAYGDSGAGPGIPGGAALVFEVELIDIIK